MFPRCDVYVVVSVALSCVLPSACSGPAKKQAPAEQTAQRAKAKPGPTRPARLAPGMNRISRRNPLPADIARDYDLEARTLQAVGVEAMLPKRAKVEPLERSDGWEHTLILFDRENTPKVQIDLFFHREGAVSANAMQTFAENRTGIASRHWVRTAEGGVPGWKSLHEDRAVSPQSSTIKGTLLRRYGTIDDGSASHVLLFRIDIDPSTYAKGPSARLPIAWINLIRALPSAAHASSRL